MSRPRKTVSVLTALGKANTFLAESPNEASERRLGVASFLEVLLMETDTYAGYGYRAEAGVERDSDGNFVSVADDSRRVYYTRKALLS